MSRPKLRLVSISVIVALLMSALLVMPAFADDGVPPAEEPAPAEGGGEVPPPADEGVTDPSEADVPTPEPAPAEVVEPAVEPAPAEAAAPPDPALASAEGAVADALGDLPDGTTVAVVSEAGEPLPLASEDAAEVLAAGDPIWCPASVSTPVSGLSGCTIRYDSLQVLLTYLKDHEPAVDGVIWIEKTYDSSDPLTGDQLETRFWIDGASETTWRNYKLTIKGGWDGLGTKTVDTTDPSVIDAALWITNWLNDVTISDVLVTNAPFNPALQVTTTGKITLTRVRVEDNPVAGAILDNTDAVSSDVLVTLSAFLRNVGADGLDIYSNGMITLTGVLANENGGHGAYVTNTAASVAKNVVMLSGVYEFNDNGASGLRVYSKGAITLKDITATGNTSGTGAYLSNVTGTGAGISLAGTNVFCENNTGLYAISAGPISASNLVANDNTNQGAYLENTSAAKALAVTLSGSNQFKFNGTGLEIYSNGAITLSNVTASYSLSGVGANLVNSMGTYSGNVTLTGANVFNQNFASGLVVSSFGAISAGNVTANWNGVSGSGVGASFNNSGAASAKAVTLTGVNQFNGNLGSGLYVMSKGAVTLSNVSANDNVDGVPATAGGTGIYVMNTFAPMASPQNVTLSGVISASGNFYYGVQIQSYGAISIANLTASDNGMAGPGYYGAILNNVSGTLARAVTLSGTNTFDNNTWTGLDVDSRGVITVNNVFAWGNDAYGVNLYNAYDGTVAGISVNGTSEFSGNLSVGLNVYSRGAITVQNFDAYENHDRGAVLANDSGASTAGITVGTSKSGWCNGLWDNYTTGMNISSFGTVTLSNICAWSNGDELLNGHGVYVYNVGAGTPKGVTLKGANSFDSNYDAGLTIYTKGPVTANSLNASGNLHADGVFIVNTYAGHEAPQNVTLTGTSFFDDNYHNGLTVSTYGAIAASNLNATGNGLVSGVGSGAVLDNYQSGLATLARAVTLTGTSDFSGNRSMGIDISSLGAISASNVSAESNLGGGGNLRNDFGTATATSPGITLGGTLNVFSGNTSFGLWIQTYGPISAAGLRAEDSDTSFGARMWNYNASTPKPVTLSGSSNTFTGNDGGAGLDIQTKGAVTIANLHASGNQSVGAAVDNTLSGTASPQNVTITGTNTFIANYHTGLSVVTYGAISLSNVTAVGNGESGGSGDGVQLNNYVGVATAAKPVTLSGFGSFELNEDRGLSIISLGAIKANSLTANWNGEEGAYIDNQWGEFASGVTLTGTNKFEVNESDGLVIFSNGAITLNSVTANWNAGDGAYLDTIKFDLLAAPQKVTLTGTNTFNDNGDFVGHTGSGLEVYTDGQITINNLTANWNADTGALLDNYYYWSTGTPGLTLTGVNTFLGNYDTGLYFDIGYGAVSLSKVTADDNGGSGVDGATDGNITIVCGSMTSNGGYGWYLWTPSVVTLKGVFSYGNGTNHPGTDPLPGGGTLVVYRACS